MMIKRVLVFLFIICLSVFAYAGPLQRAHLAVISRGSVAGEPPSYLFSADFEENDTCANLGFSSIAGTTPPDCQATDYKDGNYGLKIVDSGTDPTLTALFTESNPVFLKFDIRFGSLDYYNYVVHIYDNTVLLCRLRLGASGDIRIVMEADSDVSASVFTASADTWYTVKIKYHGDTGTSDGYGYVWYAAGQGQALSTDTGAADAALTGLSMTGTPNLPIADNHIFTTQQNASVWFDNVIVSSTDPDL
jgi:hypothetical protein